MQKRSLTIFLAVGVAIGVATHHLVYGLIIGLIIGVALDANAVTQDKKKQHNRNDLQ